VLENPCAPRDYEFDLDSRSPVSASTGNSNSKRVLRGIGDGRDCLQLTRNYLNAHARSHPHTHAHTHTHTHAHADCLRHNVPCAIGGVAPPPLLGEFYALSGYYFVFDCIRVILGEKTAIAASW
jgi:hypothetical protein